MSHQDKETTPHGDTHLLPGRLSMGKSLSPIRSRFYRVFNTCTYTLILVNLLGILTLDGGSLLQLLGLASAQLQMVSIPPDSLQNAFS